VHLVALSRAAVFSYGEFTGVATEGILCSGKVVGGGGSLA
jgi:hypothetical protein